MDLSHWLLNDSLIIDSTFFWKNIFISLMIEKLNKSIFLVDFYLYGQFQQGSWLFKGPLFVEKWGGWRACWVGVFGFGFGCLVGVTGRVALVQLGRAALLQASRRAWVSSASTNGLRQSELSRNWTAPSPRAPLNRSPSSSPTIRATTTRPSRHWRLIWLRRLAASVDPSTTRRAASGTFHCHHSPGTWFSQLKLIFTSFLFLH